MKGVAHDIGKSHMQNGHKLLLRVYMACSDLEQDKIRVS